MEANTNTETQMQELVQTFTNEALTDEERQAAFDLFQAEVQRTFVPPPCTFIKNSR